MYDSFIAAETNLRQRGMLLTILGYFVVEGSSHGSCGMERVNFIEVKNFILLQETLM